MHIAMYTLVTIKEQYIIGVNAGVDVEVTDGKSQEEVVFLA
jgi:hypothetical protein